VNAGPDAGALGRALGLLGPLLDAPPPLLVVTDFDGTLSMIDPDPLGARIDPVARTALRRLARLAGMAPDRLDVAVLSGRTALDVATRVRVGGMRYLGNHGLEGGSLPARGRAERLTVVSEHDLADFDETARWLGARVRAALGDPAWLFVEEKGPAVAFHFRAAPDADDARRRVDAAVQAGLAENGVAGFARFDGRKVVEVRPATAGAKGAAVERLLARRRPGAALALGDDVSDAEAFRVLRAWQERGDLRSVTVAVHGATETPAEVIAAADVVLPDPHAAAQLLSRLGRELERRLGPARSTIRGR
jgi:trehalose 6-phosphate phosphatase